MGDSVLPSHKSDISPFYVAGTNFRESTHVLMGDVRVEQRSCKDSKGSMKPDWALGHNAAESQIIIMVTFEKTWDHRTTGIQKLCRSEVIWIAWAWAFILLSAIILKSHFLKPATTIWASFNSKVANLTLNWIVLKIPIVCNVRAYQRAPQQPLQLQ